MPKGVITCMTKAEIHAMKSRAGRSGAVLRWGSFSDRFWSKVEKTAGCWLWTGSKWKNGYGAMTIAPRKRVRVHRFAFELMVGPIPSGMMVCHSCDVKNCVNPSHLFLGTNEDNQKDSVKKRRHWWFKEPVKMLAALASGAHKYTTERRHAAMHGRKLAPEHIEKLRKIKYTPERNERIRQSKLKAERNARGQFVRAGL